MNPRLKNFPGGYYNTVTPYYDVYKSGDLNLVSFEESIKRLEQEFTIDKNLAAVIIEPVQCTFGDQYLDSNYLLKVRELCNEYDVPLIFYNL